MKIFSKMLPILIILGCAAAKEYSTTLDPAEKFHVSWSFEETTPDSFITFTITCKDTGWVGLGFSPNGGMAGADIIMAWVTDDGSTQLLDMYAVANGAPIKDMSQDVKLLSGTKINGITKIVFKRKLNTCDKENDRIIVSSTTRLIYAYGDLNSALPQYHGATNRGAKSVYLLEPKDTTPTIPSDALTYDMHINNYTVKPVDTTYYCRFFEPPQLDTKHHIVSIETLVQKGNEALVHHIVLYGCWGVDKMHMRNSNKTGGICYTAEMPEFERSCRSVIYAWAVGGGTFYYPEEAGFAIGGTDNVSPDFFMLEVHYDNPQLLTTWRDSSGMRLTFTPTLRKEDVGMMVIGMVQGIYVPPQPDAFRAVAYCHSSCTKQWVPEAGVHMFSYFLHAHLLGAALQIDWYRDGKHIGVMAYDDSYDFNFQESRHFKSFKKVLPGDTLKITCTYSDPQRDRVTYGGLGTGSEMCLGFLSYFPKQVADRCYSAPRMTYHSDEQIYSLLSLNASTKSGHPNAAVLNDVTDWSKETVNSLQDVYDKEPHVALCYDYAKEESENSRYPIDPHEYPSKQEMAEEICGYYDKDTEENEGTTASGSHALLFSLLAVLMNLS